MDYRYCGIDFNGRMINNFKQQVREMLFKVLDRRSNRKSYTREGFIEMLKYYPLEMPKIYVNFQLVLELHIKKTGRRMKMETSKQFENEIAPFYWVEGGIGASVCLSEVGEYLQEIFDTRTDEGFIGNGYDWGSLAQVFLDEKCPKLREKINFDPEAGMFCAYSEDKEALTDFILRFKKACDDKTLILDLFSRAVLD